MGHFRVHVPGYLQTLTQGRNGDYERKTALWFSCFEYFEPRLSPLCQFNEGHQRTAATYVIRRWQLGVRLDVRRAMAGVPVITTAKQFRQPASPVPGVCALDSIALSMFVAVTYFSIVLAMLMLDTCHIVYDFSRFSCAG